MYVIVFQRRDLAVLLGRKAAEDRNASMYDQRGNACGLHACGERGKEFVTLVLIDPDAALDGHRHIDRLAHPLDTFGDERGIGHQAGAKGAPLHTIARAPDIQVDLGKARGRADPRCLRKLHRVTATQLQRQWLLGRIVLEQPGGIAANNGG